MILKLNVFQKGGAILIVIIFETKFHFPDENEACISKVCLPKGRLWNEIKFLVPKSIHCGLLGSNR